MKDRREHDPSGFFLYSLNNLHSVVKYYLTTKYLLNSIRKKLDRNKKCNYIKTNER